LENNYIVDENINEENKIRGDTAGSIFSLFRCSAFQGLSRSLLSANAISAMPVTLDDHSYRIPAISSSFLGSLLSTVSQGLFF
jgi:hypothetical protein